MYNKQQFVGLPGQWSLTRTVEPASEPITIDEATAQMRLEISDDDVLINGLIVAARNYVEEYLQRALITQTWRLTLDDWYVWEIRLPRPPLLAISSITYLDTGGTVQTLSSSIYRVSTDSQPGVVVPEWGEVWPPIRNQVDAIKITYTAGYGDASDVPQAIKHAMLMLVAHWYENREAVSQNAGQEVPLAVQNLLNPYRLIWAM